MSVVVRFVLVLRIMCVRLLYLLLYDPYVLLAPSVCVLLLLFFFVVLIHVKYRGEGPWCRVPDSSNTHKALLTAWAGKRVPCAL